MSRKAKAVLCRELNKPVVVEEIELDGPRRDEVMVRLGACGVCHSDLSATNGTIALPPPLVLGHEGAGEVVEVGEGVAGLSVGDHVVTSFIYMCGKCSFCSAGRPVLCVEQGKALVTPPEGTPRIKDKDGKPLNIFSGCGVMAEYATISVDNVVRIDPKVPLDRAALVGCGVMTGVGAVFNAAKVEPGATVAVIGCGGVGLSAVNGAALAGAERIIAIDTLASKLELARELGATDTLNASNADPVQQVKEMTGGGVHYSFEALGTKNTAEQAFGMLRPGGTATIIGMVPFGVKIELHGYDFLRDRKLQGTSMGGNRFRVDMPRLLSLWRQGRLKLDHLISGRIKLDQINEGFAALRSGAPVRQLIDFAA